MLKPGWLEEQFEKVEKEVKSWPAWMRKEAGLEKTKKIAAEGSTEK